MSEPENFLTRWSRRKRAAAEDAKSSTPGPRRRIRPCRPSPSTARAECRTGIESGAPPPARAPVSGEAESAFDLTRLPPLESITAETDIRAFLQPGVPPDLTRAALRRAWSADPRIRDFVGLADYDWDFNTPEAIAGFGPLEMTEELRRQVTEMVGRSLAPAEPDQSRPAEALAHGKPSSAENAANVESAAPPAPARPQVAEAAAGQEEPVHKDQETDAGEDLVRPRKVLIAAQKDLGGSEEGQTTGRRGHGGALPT